MNILNVTKNSSLASQAALADTFLSRMIGLLKHDTLKAGEGLMITKCQSIHMFFMRFPIDVVFADKKNQVVGLVKDIQPNRLSPIFWNASYAVELPAGQIERSATAMGDTLQIF